MPYKLRKARGKDLYWVITKATGEKHSNDPLPMERAKAQMRALYANESEKGGIIMKGRPQDVPGYREPVKYGRPQDQPYYKERMMRDVVNRESMDGSGLFDDAYDWVKNKVNATRDEFKDKGAAVLTRTNYVGPWNRLDDEYIRTHPPTDIIDEGAMKHDLDYSAIAKMREEGASPEAIDKLIRESDERFLKNIRDNWKANPWASALGYAGIRGKNIAEDTVGLDKNLFVGKGIPKGMKLSLNGAGKKLNMFEFFKGTGSIGKVAKRLGFNVVSLDCESKYTPDIEANLLEWDYKKWAEENDFVPDYIWASPPCNTFSPMVYRLHERDPHTAKPKSERAREGTAVLHKTLEIIKYFQKKNPKMLYTIENPRGMMRNDAEIKKLPNRETTLYVLYGDFKRKATDFWSNFKMNLKPTTGKYDKSKVVNVQLSKDHKTTLEQRYSIPSKLVKAILTRAKESYGSEPAMKGAGFFGDLWDSAKRGVSAVKTGISNAVSAVGNVLAGRAPREGLSPSVRGLLAYAGDKPVVELYVRRDPIQSALNTALNVISFGAWNSVRQKYQYDKFFHLQLECIVQVSDQDNLKKRFTIEKNAVIEVHTASQPTQDTEMISVPMNGVGLTMNGLLEGAKAVMGNRFYLYDAFQNNCQDFVMAMLTGSGLGNKAIYDFVKQPIDELIQEVPSWTGKIARALTDIGGVADTVIQGQGRSVPMPKFAKQLEEWGVKPMDYLAMAKKKAHDLGLAENMLSFSTDEKHKLQIPNTSGKIIRFGAVGLGDYLLYSMSGDKKADQHRSNYRKRATKIKGDWANDPYSANSLAIGVLW